MQFVDLAAQQRRIRGEIESNISAILDHGQYILGPEIKRLEERLANFLGVKHAIGCASGTDALLMALIAYEVGPGDAVFTSPFTFIATAEVISLLGATPVFVDIDPLTYNIDPAKLDLAIRAVEKNDRNIYPLPAAGNNGPITPKGVIAVDIFGLPADYDRIDNITNHANLFVIEDGAQSFGAEIAGKKACTYGNIACTSFFPAKPLGCYGDGGMCFTDDDQLSEIMESIRVHGKGCHKYDNVRIGLNGRLDTIQAGILLAKFAIFPDEIKMRHQAAKRYTDLLQSQINLVPPTIPPGYKSAWAQYSLLAQNAKHRSDIQTRLKASKIPTAVYYPKPLHLQNAFSHLGYQNGDFPVSEDCANRIFSLPMHPYLLAEEQIKIAEIVVG